MFKGIGINEFGSPISEHVCDVCDDSFTVCPPALGDGWDNCLSESCPSYDEDRDAGRLFDERPWTIIRELPEDHGTEKER